MFHVKANGDIGKCSAKAGRCPLSGQGAEHVSTMKKAREASELILAAAAGGTFGSASHSFLEKEIVRDFKVEDLASVIATRSEVKKEVARLLEGGEEVSFAFYRRKALKNVVEPVSGKPFFKLFSQHFTLGNTSVYAVSLLPTDNAREAASLSAADWEKVAVGASFFASEADAELEFERQELIFERLEEEKDIADGKLG